MLKKRLIPVLLLREGMLVKSIEFKQYRPVGNPRIAIDYFNTWEVDEIIFIDISPDQEYQIGRRDINLANFQRLSEYTEYISKKCFVPLTVGGGIHSLEQIAELLLSGADKISINTHAIENSAFIQKASKKFGRQCIVVSIDAKRKNNGEYEVFSHCGKFATGIDPFTWAKRVADLGAGEIFIQSMDRDGTLSGYDIKLIRKLADSVSIPVIACGGVGDWSHLVEGIKDGHAEAVSAANIFHYTEHSTKHAKNYLKKSGIDMR